MRNGSAPFHSGRPLLSSVRNFSVNAALREESVSLALVALGDGDGSAGDLQREHGRARARDSGTSHRSVLCGPVPAPSRQRVGGSSGKRGRTEQQQRQGAPAARLALGRRVEGGAGRAQEMFDLVAMELVGADQELEPARKALDIDPLDTILVEAAVLGEPLPCRIGGRPGRIPLADRDDVPHRSLLA